MKRFFQTCGVIALMVTCCSSVLSQSNVSVEQVEGEILVAPENIRAQYKIDLQQLERDVASSKYPNIHSILIAKTGKLVYENYFSGADQDWGSYIGVVQHSPSSLHDLRSVTKSVLSICVGIAIQQGYIKSIDDKVSDYFPEFTLHNIPGKSDWTLKHFLTMTTGLEWNEKIPYTDPRNDEERMTSSSNPIRFVLEKALIEQPGISFNYNGGATQVLAEVIKRASHMPLDKFAIKYLFTPLGITYFEWNKIGPTAGFSAASGLRLRSRDLMKIGLLYRNSGEWQGHQVVSQNWIEDSWSAHTLVKPYRDGEITSAYGYLFWLAEKDIGNHHINFSIARGNGGQRIYWDHHNDLVIVITAGHYNQRYSVMEVLEQSLYPNIQPH